MSRVAGTGIDGACALFGCVRLEAFVTHLRNAWRGVSQKGTKMGRQCTHERDLNRLKDLVAKGVRHLRSGRGLSERCTQQWTWRKPASIILE